MRWWSTRRWRKRKQPSMVRRGRLCWSNSSSATSRSSGRHRQDRRRVVEGRAVVEVQARRVDVETKSRRYRAHVIVGDALYASCPRDLLRISLVRTLKCIHYFELSFLPPPMSPLLSCKTVHLHPPVLEPRTPGERGGHHLGAYVTRQFARRRCLCGLPSDQQLPVYRNPLPRLPAF